jgi:hypothetical protein
MKIIIRLKGLWFFSLVVFGIGVLLELSNGELNGSTLIVFFIYCILYYIASWHSDRKSDKSM